MQKQIKTVGSNGQISLGMAFAGKMVLIDQLEDGSLLIKTGEFIPDNEKWLHHGADATRLNQALDWAAQNPAEDNFETFNHKFDSTHD